MDPNVKPQTMLETFDQANYNSIPEYKVALITLLTYPAVSTCTAERSFSGMKRLQTPLRSTMTDERLSSLAILHIHKHKDVIDIDGIITVCPSERYTARLLLVTSLMASLFLPFFAGNSLYLTDNTRDG